MKATRKPISLIEKLILYFVGLSLFAISLLSTISYYQVKRGIISRTLNQLNSVRTVKKKQVVSFFTDRENELQAIARLPEIQNIAKRLCKPGGSDTTSIMNDSKLDHLLLNILFSSSYFSKIRICGNNGLSLEISGNREKYKEKNWKKIVSGNDYSSEFMNEIAHNKGIVLIDSAVSSEKEYRLIAGLGLEIGEDNTGAVLICEIPMDPVISMMYAIDPQNGLGISGESYLVGRDFKMRTPSRFINNSVMSVIAKTAGVTEAFRNICDAKIIRDYRNIEVLSSFDRIHYKNIDWAILAEIDFSEAMVPVRQLRDSILLITLFISTLVFFVTLLISRSITRPLTGLRNAVSLMEQGKYNFDFNVKSNDEIGALTQAFNNMALRIRTQTGELIEREERLCHFYEATKDGIVLHDNGTPVLVNHALSDLTGYSVGGLMKMNVNEFVKLRPDLLHRNYDTVAYGHERKTFDVEVQENPIEFKGKMIRAVVIRDITLRKNMEKELNVERNKSLRSVIDGQENERQRFSRELHDGIGQSLIALKLKLENMRFRNDKNHEDLVGELKLNLDDLIDEIRRISNNLLPAVLKELGLIIALKKLCKETAVLTHKKLTFTDNIINTSFNDTTNIYIYRIAQEALNNAVKHSNAGEITIELTEEDCCITLIICDDGIGFSTEDLQRKLGRGFHNIHERASLMNGRLEINSDNGKGTCVRLTVPKSESLYMTYSAE
ncbi:MAG: histidine kinase, partial [Bacteroidia bacterium]|nr:histidine kinase [Bacteroidia bacterium]